MGVWGHSGVLRFGLEVLVTDTVRVFSHANNCLRVFGGALRTYGNISHCVSHIGVPTR